MLDSIDKDTAQIERNDVRLYFVKRIGDKYPGNIGQTMSGPLCQEVIRALMHRLIHLDGQRDHHLTKSAIADLRSALRKLEVRAALLRDDPLAAGAIADLIEFPELEPTCSACGHVLCARHP